MQALITKVLSEARGIWRFRWPALAVSWGVCLLGWFAVYAFPEIYESSARIFVNTRTTLRPLLQGLAVERDVESQLNAIRQTLLSRPNLAKVARSTEIDINANTPAEIDALLMSLGRSIDIQLEPPKDPRLPSTQYRIAYRDTDRERAIKVVDVLLNSFVESTMGSTRTSDESAQRFLQRQLEEYGARLADAETKLADFKKKNLGLVPGDDGGYFQRLQAQAQELERLQSQLSVAQSRRSELVRQLRGETPYVPLPGGGSTASSGSQQGGEALDTAGRIRQTQARLDELLLRFTEKHPDVIAARQTLEDLKARRVQELAALRRGDASSSDAGATANPVYQNIQLAMNQADVEIAALQGDLANRQRNIADLRRLVDTAPEVEAQYSRLTRDYDVNKAQYTALLERLERARLSEGAEETGLVRFDMIDPPNASFSPITPPRSLLVIGVMFAALAAGVGAAFLMHMIKPVFNDPTALASLTGLTVFGTVGVTWMDRRKLEIRREYFRYGAAAAGLFGAFVLAVALNERGARFVHTILS